MKVKDIIILGIILVWFAISLFLIIRSKKKGKCLCCGKNCSECEKK